MFWKATYHRQKTPLFMKTCFKVYHWWTKSSNAPVEDSWNFLVNSEHHVLARVQPWNSSNFTCELGTSPTCYRQVPHTQGRTHHRGSKNACRRKTSMGFFQPLFFDESSMGKSLGFVKGKPWAYWGTEKKNGKWFAKNTETGPDVFFFLWTFWISLVI